MSTKKRAILCSPTGYKFSNDALMILLFTQLHKLQASHIPSNQSNMNYSKSSQGEPTVLEPQLITLFPEDYLGPALRNFPAYTHGPSHNRDEKYDKMAPAIIFCLRFFDCDAASISRVLESYGFSESTGSVSRYIGEKDFIRYFDLPWHPNSGEMIYKTKPSEYASSVAIDYEKGLPVRVEIDSKDLHPLAPTKHVIVQTADGRRISTSVTEEKISCRRIFNQNR